MSWPRLRAEVATLHAELPRWGLVVWTAGNVSARVPGHDLLVIKPSGVGYDELTPGGDGGHRSGRRSWSTATVRHPRTRPRTPTSTSTCPRWAAWSTPTRRTRRRGQRAASRFPCVLTMMADEFGGEIPVGPFALIGDDSVGRGIVETLRSHRSPAVLMQNHGPFTIGPDRQGRRQGGGDVRGGRPDRAHRPSARRTARHRAVRHRLAVRPLPERLRPDRRAD